MRECGIASAEAATAGPNLVSGLDTLEDRRSGNAEAGENGGIDEGLIMLKPLRAATSVENAHDPLLRIDHPNGLASVGKIEFDFVLETRRRFRGDYFDRKLRSTL